MLVFFGLRNEFMESFVDRFKVLCVVVDEFVPFGTTAEHGTEGSPVDPGLFVVHESFAFLFAFGGFNGNG